ncbi:hypothetical protein KPL70_025947 [Citrus sinensis]|nr:hypothetical protein KPL70_025947 [Citrus sinensis]
MHRQLPFKALNQRNSPLNISFQSAYQLQDFAKKFLYRYFFNVQTKKPDRFPNLYMEHLFLTGLTLSSLSICEDELWYMWCLTTLYATKLVFPVKPILTHLTTPEFSPDLLWTLLECKSSYPLISPYQLYKRPSSFTRSIRTLISTRWPQPKEYIQSSRLDQCALQATSAEQYVTLEIPSELISNWKREGYTHLHLGGIRLILTLHGRKGLPVTAQLAMLDTRFKQYQEAVIGTVLTTLHAGSVLLTFYPNFNLSLQDTNLPTTLKVQVQIQGAEQISSAKIATLHHQLVYRLQNHALDLPNLEHHSDTLMVLAESDQIPTIIQIPRQLHRHELIKLMPLEWISNYEQFHTNTAPIQTSESMFERRQDGTIAQEDLPITGFNSDGYPVYPAKQNGHFLWDVPGSGMCDSNCPCWDDWEEDDDYATKKRPKKKKPPISCHHYSSSSFPPLETHTDSHRNVPSMSIPGQQSLPPAPPLPPQSQTHPQSKDKEPMHQYSAHTIDPSSTPDDQTSAQTSDSNLAITNRHFKSDTESSVSTSDSEKSYADITRILMAQPDQPDHAQTSHTEPYVDIPSEVDEDIPEFSATHQPPPRLTEMSAWIDLQMLRPGATTQSVLREFATRFTGALRDWFDSLGQYRQLQFVQLPEVSSALAVIHDQFLGDPSAVFEAARRDYLNMKCYSLNAKDLDFHYKRMCLLFYKFNGFNEPTLKHVFLASLLEELQPDIQRQLTASNLILDNISLGKIFQIAKTCLDKLCEQKQFFKDLLRDNEPFRSACKKPYLQIKCKKKKDCDCGSHAEHHQLLTQFYDIVQSHGIMLSAKKSTIATDTIEFLGMIIKDDHYQPGKHIAQELLHFPDQQLSKKQVQQFLGIINYIRDFIPHMDRYTHHLSALLKKKPQEWNADHTTTVTILKQIVQNLPPLKLITDGKRILQTNASDESWGAILTRMKSSQISESQFPIMSPYNLYKQKTSFTRSIRTLISTKRPLPKEYIQSSRLDQCALQASQSEQYVTMEIPSDLVANWKREGYTHLHLGGVRLILTLHGRKGLPVTARIALLDTRFKEYQHAVIGTVLTTLHAGSVLLTFYPNFNLSLEDPNLSTTLKVQIQLQGAEQTPTSKIATLHHQIVYQLQNHALDLPTPYTTSDAMMILADTDTIPTIIQIPKQIQKQELLRLMPLEWLTNYEHFHQNLEPVQTTEATFNRRPNGQVKLSFQTPDTEPVSNSPQLSYTAMITAVQTGQEKKLPIYGFSSEGYPVYPDKINGHFLWDVSEAHMCNPDCPCLDDTDIDEELEIMRRKKKKKKKSSYPPSSCKSFPPHPPLDPKPPVHPIRSCLMFSSHSYEESFPPLEKQTDTQTRVTSKPFVQSPITASGQPEEPKQYEAVLNWQTKNTNAQNHTLQQLGKKIDRVATQVSQTETKVDSISSRLDQMYIHLQDRISELDADLRRMINNHIWGPEFNKKEAEVRKLKAELSRIDAEKTRPSFFTQSQPTPVSPPFFETYSPFYTPSRPQQPVYNQFFGFSHLQQTPQRSSPKLARSKVKISEPRPKATSSSSTSTIPPEESPQDRPEPLKKDKGPMDQYHYHTVQTQTSDFSDSSEPETHNSCSSSSYDSSNASTDSEFEYADITGILMATETADPSVSTSTPIVDDNPSDQFMNTQQNHLQHLGTKPNAQPQAVLREFMARSTGSLRDWLESLGEYRQLQFMESPIGTALNLIHEQFIGEKTASTEADRKEYHQMKCCSLKRHLLDAHYKRMSILFYNLNGFNEPSLKHVFIASLPPELQPDLQRKLTATNLSIADISLGKIFQMAMLSLDKICEQKEFFKDLMEDKKPFSEACKKPYLKIECKDEKKCVCPTTKKRHFRKHFHRKSSSKKPFHYFKKKDVSQYRKKKSNRCFICKKRRHFARNCPHKPAKAVRLIQHLQHSSLLSENDDVESNFSEQSTQDDQTAFLIAESSDSEDISVISTI